MGGADLRNRDGVELTERRIRFAARWFGVPVCVSGAGPSLVVFERSDRPPSTLDALGLTSPWRILRPGIRSRGFEVEIGGGRDGSGDPPLQRGSIG